LQIACIFLRGAVGVEGLPALCASSGLRRGRKHSAGKDIGKTSIIIGFVLRGCENGCIDSDIETSDRMPGRCLRRRSIAGLTRRPARCRPNQARRSDMPFQPGQSGNPAGRPRGSRNKGTVIAEKLLDDGAGELTRAAIARAIDGDPAALRACMDRLLPPLRHRPLDFDLPPLVTLADAPPAINAIAQGLAHGELDREGAAVLLRAVREFTRALAAVERAKRAADSIETECALDAAAGLTEDADDERPRQQEPDGPRVGPSVVPNHLVEGVEHRGDRAVGIVVDRDVGPRRLLVRKPVGDILAFEPQRAEQHPVTIGAADFRRRTPVRPRATRPMQTYPGTSDAAVLLL
jgi:Family of unknown function (DUF5681)